MRVTFNGMLDRSALLQADQTERLFDLSRQLATGQKFELPSDNPLDSTAIRRFTAKITEKESKVRSLGLAQDLLNMGETSLREIEDQLQRARVLAVQLGNGTYTTADRSLAAQEINEILDAAFRLGNTTSGGRGVFAGAQTNEPAFSAVRNSGGEITSVTYEGDDTTLEVAGDGRNLDVSLPGSEAFAAVPRVLASTSNNFDGSMASKYADREVAASMLPSSGILDGQMRVNGVLVSYDLDGNPTTGEGDSLLDLARKINEVQAGATATVEGNMNGTIALADPTAAIAGLTAGTISIGGALGTSSITVTAADSLAQIRDRINVESGRTGVSASLTDAAGNIVDGVPAFALAAGPFRLRLSGGVEITDNGATNSNALQLAGITRTPSAATGANLIGTLSAPYRLLLTNDGPGVFQIEDAQGSILRDLGLTNGTAAPGNIPAAAIRTDGTVFDALIDLRDALRTGADATVRDLIETFDSAIDSVVTHRTTAGARSKAASDAATRLEDDVLYLKDARSRIEDADLAKVIADLKTEETANEAALRATAGLLGLSLLDFLG